MSISLEQAKAFCAVVEQKGYAQAAEYLNKSHSALVYLIKSLESQLNVQVFDRESYRNQLTPTGRRVFQKCKEIMSKVEELDILCQELHDDWEASVKVVFDGIMSIHPFIEIYKEFKLLSIPTIVQTYTDYLQDVEKTFENLQADMMISVSPVKNKNLISFELEPLKIFLVAHKDHPLNKQNKKWTLSEMKQFYFLTVHGDVQLLGLNTSVFEESASFFLSDFSFKKEAIIKKLGFGWLPEHLIESELKNKVLVPVKWERKSESTIQPILYIKKQSTGGQSVKMIKDRLITRAE